MKLIRRAVVLLSSLLLLAGCAAAPKETAQVKDFNSGIKGQVIVANEGAASGAFVYAYDSTYNDMRVPTKNISAPCGEDGSYTLKLPPGKYYIVARRRVTGDPKGYLVKGDYEGKYVENPVVVEQGGYADVNISIAKLEGAFLLAPYLADKGNTGITGKVYNEDGSPAKGAYVLLYTDKEMIGLPLYLSKPTGKDGSYSIYLPKAGAYYVAARLKYGGIPRKGEPYGTYDKTADHLVAVGENEVITEVDVKLGPFPLDLAKPAK